MVKFCQIGATLVQNCGDSEIGKLVIQVAKERKYKTISIIDNKPGTPDIIEELKALGGDIVVPESYTKTWYFLLSLPCVTIMQLFLMINSFCKSYEHAVRLLKREMQQMC